MRSLVLIAAAILVGCVDDAAPAPEVEVPDGADAPAPGAGANATAPAPTAPAPVALEVVAEGFYPVNPSFRASADAVPSGAEVTLTYRNEDTNPLGKHDWMLEGLATAKTEVIEKGASATVVFRAPSPGEYRYVCSVEGHAERGMVGTLVVTPS